MSTAITVNSLPSSFKSADLVFDEQAFKKSTIQLLLNYEIASSWWAPLISSPVVEPKDAKR